VILGAGGTAQAAVAALRELGCRSALALVRDPARARELAATAGRLGVGLEIGPITGPPIEDADLVISTVPKGAADHLAAIDWAPGAVLFDVVYDPWPTVLAESAERAGCRIVSGLDLLLHQAGHQVRLMTGHDAPIEAMRAALTAARR
jgi:shikimate dehydrogenase